MKIISFAWTTPALLARRKSVTRRDWTDRYGLSFKAGELVQAWDRSPRYKGHRVGTIRLTQDPIPEAISKMPDSDFEAEGFAFMEANGFHLRGEPVTRGLFDAWRSSGAMLWVVRFEIVELLFRWNAEEKWVEAVEAR